jgi:hypothetical protein
MWSWAHTHTHAQASTHTQAQAQVQAQAQAQARTHTQAQTQAEAEAQVVQWQRVQKRCSGNLHKEGGTGGRVSSDMHPGKDGSAKKLAVSTGVV